MSILDLKIEDVTIKTIARGGTYKISSYKINKKDKVIDVNVIDDENFAIFYNENNLNFLEKNIYNNIVQFKEGYQEAVKRLMPLIKTSLCLDAIILLPVIEIKNILSLLMIVCLIINDFRRLQNIKKIQKKLDDMEWVYHHQEEIDKAFEDISFFMNLNSESIEMILRNGNHYNLNIYDNISLEDRQKIYKKVENINE